MNTPLSVGDLLAQEQFQEECPEQHASIFSKATFWWFNPMMAKGYRKILEIRDMYRLRPEDRAEFLSEEFDKYWRSQRHPLVMRTFHRCFGRDFYIAGLFRLIGDTTQLIAPFFIKLIIDYMSNPNAPRWIGFSYVLMLMIISFLGTTLQSQYMHYLTSVSMRVRTALRSAIYSKLLRLSTEARHKMNTGDITNYMSIDAQKIGDLILFLHQTWSTVYQMIVCMLFLIYFIGISTLAGVSIMIIVIPVQSIIARLLQRIRRQILKHSGDRIRTINEILMGIRVIKFYAWENPFVQKVLAYREEEMRKIKQSVWVNTFSSTIMTIAPVFVSICTFGLYALLGNELKPAVIFPALSYLNQLRFPLAMLPTVVGQIAESRVSLKRLQDFLLAEEITPQQYGDDTEHPIKIANGEFVWNSEDQSYNIKDDSTSKVNRLKKKEEQYAQLEDEENEEEIAIDVNNTESPTKENSPKAGKLKDINVKIKKGSLTAVVGLVGSGKSSFLSAIIGEMKQLSGTTEISGRIAYCPQQAWIQNCSVRDNILFGHDFDEKLYHDTIGACALQHDIQILPAGDATEIGEKGINLSGGQRQRINLARAVYSNADIYLLDDILSAVDADVGKFIFEKCIGNNGLLKDKTRVLVTHQWQYLRHCDNIILFKDGRIEETGSYNDLISHDGSKFAQMVKAFTTSEDNDESNENEVFDSLSEEKAIGIKEDNQNTNKESNVANIAKGKFMEMEERETGAVKSQVYNDYIKYAGGYNYVIVIIIMYVFTQAMLIGSNWWLAFWSTQTSELMPTEKPNHSLSFYMTIYFGFGIAAALLQLIRELLLSFIGLYASKNLHSKALYNIVHAPVRFFDTTPLGRIINRFSKDIESVDTTLIMSLKTMFLYGFNLLGIFVTITYVTPLFILPIVPIMVAYYFVQLYYRRTNRELKRLESISRSPLFAFFSETLTGISTIRAYNVTERFQKENEKRLDLNNMPYFCQLCSQRWLSLRLEWIGTSVIASTSLFCVISKGFTGIARVDAEMAGLALSYALQITGTLNWTIRAFSESEAAMNSVERVLHYCDNIEQEAAYENTPDMSKPSSNWPTAGNISFNNVFLKYREDLDYVLKGLTANIFGSEKIGIVGRTGAGKSSLMSALFRLTELAEGSITIDGIDISTIALFDLRSRLSIIPQDPVLFSGTVRFNLDPFNNYTDNEVWKALERSHMKTTVESLPLQLSAPVAEYGENFSVGQRQLFCLARAILRQNKILVMDEATANVDQHTDSLIQQTVRSEFADCTVLTIAHRLNTVIDYDRIMVLDHGYLVEFDTPKNLLDPNIDTCLLNTIEEQHKDHMQHGRKFFMHLCEQTGKENFKYLKSIVNGKDLEQ